jgi:hypothetical protein
MALSVHGVLGFFGITMLAIHAAQYAGSGLLRRSSAKLLRNFVAGSSQ